MKTEIIVIAWSQRTQTEIYNTNLHDVRTIGRGDEDVQVEHDFQVAGEIWCSIYVRQTSKEREREGKKYIHLKTIAKTQKSPLLFH